MQTHRAKIVTFLLIFPLIVSLLIWRERRPYTLQELNTPDCLDSMAFALNNRGQVAGWCSTPSHPQQAILWQNGSARRLNRYGFRFSVKSRLLYLEATGFTENRAHYR